MTSHQEIEKEIPENFLDIFLLFSCRKVTHFFWKKRKKNNLRSVYEHVNHNYLWVKLTAKYGFRLL